MSARCCLPPPPHVLHLLLALQGVASHIPLLTGHVKYEHYCVGQSFQPISRAAVDELFGAHPFIAVASVITTAAVLLPHHGGETVSLPQS